MQTSGVAGNVGTQGLMHQSARPKNGTFGFISQGNTNVGKLATLTMYHYNIYKGKFDFSPKLNNFMTQ